MGVIMDVQWDEEDVVIAQSFGINLLVLDDELKDNEITTDSDKEENGRE